MRCFWPCILMVIGSFIWAGGLYYDVMYAGIPYQDPTPEMSARYNHHKGIASVIYWIGGGAFLLGSFAGIIRLVIRRF